MKIIFSILYFVRIIPALILFCILYLLKVLSLFLLTYLKNFSLKESLDSCEAFIRSLDL